MPDAPVQHVQPAPCYRLALLPKIIIIVPKAAGEDFCLTMLAALWIFGQRFGGHVSVSTLAFETPKAFFACKVHGGNPESKSMHSLWCRVLVMTFGRARHDVLAPYCL